MNQHPIASTMAPNPCGPLAMSNINLGVIRSNLVKVAQDIREEVRPAGVNFVNEVDERLNRVYRDLEELGRYLVGIDAEVMAATICEDYELPEPRDSPEERRWIAGEVR